jgi:hypothetical protein
MRQIVFVFSSAAVLRILPLVGRVGKQLCCKSEILDVAG